MKKIIYIGGAAIWLIIIAFVVVQWSHAPSKDEYKSVVAYANVLKDYSDVRPIDVNKIEDRGVNTQFARVTAGFFAELQKIETPLNEKYNSILAAKDVSSLLNAEASARNKAAIPAFIAEANAVQQQREVLYDKYMADIKALPIKGLIFPVEPMIKGMKDERVNRAAYTNDMIGVATYTSYIIDFVNSRRAANYFSSNGQKLTFAYPDDQKYYDALVVQLDAHRRGVEKFRANLKSNIDAAVNGLGMAANKDKK